MAGKKTAGARGNEDAGQRKPPIVGIGASAGGVQALQTLFEHLADHLGLAYVVILHLAPEIRSELAAILRSRTKMEVTTVDGPIALEADHVYVIPPDRALSITDHHIS